MRNVLAVKSVRSMPCKAIGKKKKKKLIKTEETFAKRPVLWTWPTYDFFSIITQQASRKVTELGFKFMCKIHSIGQSHCFITLISC